MGFGGPNQLSLNSRIADQRSLNSRIAITKQLNSRIADQRSLNSITRDQKQEICENSALSPQPDAPAKAGAGGLYNLI